MTLDVEKLLSFECLNINGLVGCTCIFIKMSWKIINTNGLLCNAHPLDSYVRGVKTKSELLYDFARNTFLVMKLTRARSPRNLCKATCI